MVASWLLAVSTALIVAFVLAAHDTATPNLKGVFDNVHWTIAYFASAALVWLGCKNASPKDLPARRWSAIGCTCVAAGQVVFDLQAVFGWKGVGPAEILYFLMVPCFLRAIAHSLRADLPRREVSMAYLDALGLTLAFGMVAMTVFLPSAAGSNIPQIATAAIFPVGFFATISLGTVATLALRSDPDRGWILFLASMVGSATLWFIWNIYLIAGTLQPGTWFNGLFSVVAITLGIGAMNLRARPSANPKLILAYESVQRLEPLLIVLLTGFAFIFSRTVPGVTSAIQGVVEGGMACVVCIALIRQNVLLSERARLIEAQRQLQASKQVIRDSEERYRSLVVGAVDGIIIVETSGICLDINPAGAAMIGRQPEEIIGKQIASFVDATDATKVTDGLKLVNSGDTVEGEWRLRRKDDSLCWIGVRAKMLEDGTMQGFCRDITDRKKAEEFLRQAEETQRELDRKLMHSQKLEAVGTLAAGIAHDFNNLLSAIRGNAELAIEDLPPGHPALTSVEEIRKAGSRATSLVQQILAFSSQQQQPEEVVALPGMISEIATMLRSILPANVELATSFEGDIPQVVAEPIQIHQVIVNLCTNAWQAMEGRSGRIEITLSSKRFSATEATLLSLSEGDYAQILIKDNGAGMDTETAERAYEPFFTTKVRGQGTGLGLAVARNIIVGHLGAISFDSILGVGTTFRILLPAAPTPSPAPAHNPAPANSAKPAIVTDRVAYVDDEEALSFLVKRALERKGYRVTAFPDAEQALVGFQADPFIFDILITDYNMPGMSGIGLANAVRALRPEIPIVLTSGYISDQIRDMAESAGIDQFVYKPDSVEELVSAIHELAGQAR